MVYGESYRSAGTVFGILSLVIILVVQATVLSNYLFAKNMPEKHRYFTLVRAILLAGIIYPLIRMYGTVGAAVAVLISNAAAILVQTYQMKMNAGIRIRDYWGSWVPGFVSGCSVFVAIWFIRSIVT